MTLQSREDQKHANSVVVGISKAYVNVLNMLNFYAKSSAYIITFAIWIYNISHLFMIIYLFLLFEIIVMYYNDFH